MERKHNITHFTIVCKNKMSEPVVKKVFDVCKKNVTMSFTETSTNIKFDSVITATAC